MKNYYSILCLNATRRYFLFEIEKYISGLIAPGFTATIPLNSTVFTNISQYGPRQNRNDFDL